MTMFYVQCSDFCLDIVFLQLHLVGVTRFIPIFFCSISNCIFPICLHFSHSLPFLCHSSTYTACVLHAQSSIHHSCHYSLVNISAHIRNVVIASKSIWRIEMGHMNLLSLFGFYFISTRSFVLQTRHHTWMHIYHQQQLKPTTSLSF